MPIKLMAFGRAVDVTLGLPIVRTAVDHGTGFAQGAARLPRLRHLRGGVVLLGTEVKAIRGGAGH